MDGQIALFLAQDGIINGAIYALMALALVLVFSVTRVIFVPQGELVAYGALTMAVLQAGGTPATLWLLWTLAAVTLVLELWRLQRGAAVDWWSTALWCGVLPVLAALAVWWRPESLLGKALTVLLVVTPLGPLIYRLAFRPLAHATVLVLLIVSVALHGVLMGLGLWFFGAEGSRTPAFSEARFELGGIPFSGQSLVVLGVTVALVGAMFVFFERTLLGKALRATAINRVGARLMGIPIELSGDVSFALAALIGAVSGLLIAHHHDLLRHRFSDWPQGVRGRHHRRAGQLPRGAAGGGAGGAARGLCVLLGQRVQGGAGVHADHSGAAVAFAAQPPCGG